MLYTLVSQNLLEYPQPMRDRFLHYLQPMILSANSEIASIESFSQLQCSFPLFIYVDTQG